MDGGKVVNLATEKLEAGKTYDVQMITKDTTKDSTTVAIVEKTLYATQRSCLRTLLAPQLVEPSHIFAYHRLLYLFGL